MKYMGIIRKMDELGRIVIPKEIRNVLHIKSNDDLEFLIEDNHIILCKDNKTDLETISNDYIESTKDLINGTILVTNQENILTYGDYYNCKIPFLFQSLLQDRKEYTSFEKENILFNEHSLLGYYYVVPIICESNCLGIIILCSNIIIKDSDKLYCQMLKKLIENK